MGAQARDQKGTALTIWRRLGLPFHLSRIHFDRHETKSVRENLVLDDGCVVVHVDILNRYCGHLRDSSLSGSVDAGGTLYTPLQSRFVEERLLYLRQFQ